MTDNAPILVTGAAGKIGAVGRTVTDLLFKRELPVRAMVRREDDYGQNTAEGDNALFSLTRFILIINLSKDIS